MCGTRIIRKKKKTKYITKKSSGWKFDNFLCVPDSYCIPSLTDYDKAELELYEEVARMPPFERKTLVLIGAQGVGKRSLMHKLIAHDPQRFGTTMPRMHSILSLYDFTLRNIMWQIKKNLIFCRYKPTHERW